MTQVLEALPAPMVQFPPIRPFSPKTLISGEYAAPKSIPLKTLEESAELVEATKAWLKNPDDEHRRPMLDELADVLQTVANMCLVYQITETELEDAIKACEQRNRSRGRIDAGHAE